MGLPVKQFFIPVEVRAVKRDALARTQITDVPGPLWVIRPAVFLATTNLRATAAHPTEPVNVTCKVRHYVIQQWREIYPPEHTGNVTQHIHPIQVPFQFNRDSQPYIRIPFSPISGKAVGNQFWSFSGNLPDQIGGLPNQRPGVRPPPVSFGKEEVRV